MEDRAEASERIRVLIVSAYGPLRTAIREMLEHENIDVVAESASARQAISLAHMLRPQVTVADERLVDSDAHTLCRKLHKIGTPTRCIILTSWPVQSTGKPLPGDPIFLLREIANSDLPGSVRAAAQGTGPTS